MKQPALPQLPLPAALLMALLAAPTLAQGGTMISEAPYLGFLGYAGYYGDELASIDNGTGRHDLVVAEPAYYNQVHLLDGLSGASLDVLGNTEFASGSYFGRDVKGVGDLNGDGLQDFAIGAPGNSGGGQVFLFLQVPGSAPQLWNTLVPPGPNLWEFGTALDEIGDLDGDGVGDVLVGQRGAQYSSILYPGYGYAYSGATGQLIHRFSALDGQASLIGFGKSIASLPDVDGDGTDDVAVGGGYGSVGTGFVRVFSGATGDLIRQIDSTTFSGGGGWANELAGVDDLNGDGRGDLVIASPGINRVRIVSPVDGETLGVLTPPVTQFGMQYGFALSAGADVSGDGINDILVGAPYENVGGPWDKGRAYLYSGADGDLLRIYERPADYLPGFDFHEYFGRGVLLSPDLNGDGRGDVVVGAPGLDVPLTGDGAVFTFFCLDEVEASAEVRLGTPPNPQAFSAPDPPLIGGAWTAAIDHASFVPGAQLDLALFALGEANLPAPGGTLLVDPAQLLFTLFDGTAAGQFEVPIPSDCALVGRTLSAQGISWDGAEFIGANALDLTIGSF